MERISKDDPRFTAKALGERDDELDALEIAPEDVEQFEALETFAKQLETELGSDVSDERLDRIRLEALKEAQGGKGRRGKLLSFPSWAYSVAACVAIGMFSVLVMTRQGDIQVADQSMSAQEEEHRGKTTSIHENTPQPSRPISVENKEQTLGSNETIVVESSNRLPSSTVEEEVFELENFKIDGDKDRVYYPRQGSTGARLQMEYRGEPIPLVTPEAVEEFGFSDTEISIKYAPGERVLIRTPKAVDAADSTPAAKPKAVTSGGASESESRPSVSRAIALANETEVFELSPFTVDANEDVGYIASNTLAGARFRSDAPKDIGTSIQVFTQEFMQDTGAGDVEEVLQFATSTEISGNLGNFSAQVPEPALPAGVDTGNTGRGMIHPSVSPYPLESSSREGYAPIEENDFRSPQDTPFSTFSIDVDTASYSNMRRMIEQGRRPVPDAIRIEELINYFKYDYPQPEGDAPFSVNIESAAAPWKPEHHLLRIGLQGKTIPMEERPPANLVFLVDVSGSMGHPNKLPLAQASLKLLVEQMGAEDRIALVVYAGSSGLVLPSTTANNKETINHAIDTLRSGGSTNGGAGIELAYKVATEKLIEDGINRVILCTDGDFNVGVSDDGSLVRLIEEKAASGVFFSAIGFGQGNYQDAKMEQLSNKGNGNYAYIDTKQEARKVFVDDMLGTLHTIAKDVKIQVDFNPAQVNAYRLIGYVNRKLAKEDFNDDTKDAGEIGAGHSVTALYEIVPAGVDFDTATVDASKYQRPAKEIASSPEWLTVKLRYKQPDEDVSSLLEFPFTGEKESSFASASADFRFAASVAGFGMLLRDSAYKGDLALDAVIEYASQARGSDPSGWRSEFIELARKTKPLLEN